MISSNDAEDATVARSIRVWDAPTRVFHWLLAASFAGAWLLSETERYRNLHAGFGYAVVALVAFRIVWGLVGTRHARFKNFLGRPRAVGDYLRGMLRGAPGRYVGHNPLGALAIVALLGLALATAVTGYMTLNELGGDVTEELHEACASAWLGMVVVHLAGVLVSSVMHRENLVRAMVTGWKRGHERDGIGRAWAPLGALLVVIAAGAFAWGSGLVDGSGVGAQSTLAASGISPDNSDED